MVEVFRTNVTRHLHARLLIQKLALHFPACKINFDLSDCDRILRVEGDQVLIEEVTALLTKEGYLCELLL